MRVKFSYYLMENGFDKNVNIILKYLRRYDVEKFDEKIRKFKKIKKTKSVSQERPLYNYQKKWMKKLKQNE